MNKRDFLKTAGLLGASSLLTTEITTSIAEAKTSGAECVLIPSETAGPFPLDLTANNFYFRNDVREQEQGVILNLKLKILGKDNCLPMQNVRVNIWHCNKQGLYSGYDNNMNAGQAGKTYLRGYQITDANGEVNFKTVFPGWYNGRICHIHFQVYVSSVYSAVSQLTFPLDTKNALYSENSSLYTKGADPLSFNQDNIFSDGYNYQIATLVKNSDGSYNSSFEVTVQGAGKGQSGLANHEPETGGEFKLAQNSPNPYSTETTIPFTLVRNSDVLLQLWDLSGKVVAEIERKNLPSGQNSISLNFAALGLPTGNYAYHLRVKNSEGIFMQSKMMTALRK